MCRHIQGGAFADLRLGGRRENQIDFRVLRSMERLRNQMKRAAGFLGCNRSMVVDRELTTQVRRKHRMDRAAMDMIGFSMMMIGLRMDMHQGRGEQP